MKASTITSSHRSIIATTQRKLPFGNIHHLYKCYPHLTPPEPALLPLTSIFSEAGSQQKGLIPFTGRGEESSTEMPFWGVTVFPILDSLVVSSLFTPHFMKSIKNWSSPCLFVHYTLLPLVQLILKKKDGCGEKSCNLYPKMKKRSRLHICVVFESWKCSPTTDQKLSQNSWMLWFSVFFSHE